MKKLRVKIRGSFSIQPKVPENFGWYIVHQNLMYNVPTNGPFRFGLSGIFGTSFEGGPL